MRKISATLVLTGLLGGSAAAETLLLREPDVSDTQIVFAYARDIWIVGREGGEARRLTSYPGVEGFPKFSPDGSQVAFIGEYDGNADVFVVGVEGGEPRRLTWHPGDDLPRGWSPDGERVVFASGRTGAPIPIPRFWSVATSGGAPEPLPMPRIWSGKYSPDGKSFVYDPVLNWESEWRNYRGGQNKPIWLLDLEDYSLEKLPWEGSNDTDPVFVGDTIYFLSDRDFAVNVYSWRRGEADATQLTFFREYDARNLESGGGVLVFEQEGRIHLLDPAAGGGSRAVPITVRGDFPWARPHWEEVGEQVREGRPSPTGKRALFEARGEIFTVPAEKGDVRNLTRTSGAAERAPAWSPDGRRVSWFSDASGEYALVLADQFGEVEKTIELDDATFFYTPQWSPDSERLAFGDADRNLWVVEAATGKRTWIDNEGYAHPDRTIYPEWSPDSRWIAYTKRLDNQYNAVWVYSVEDDTRHPVTDGLSDSRAPAWDASGKYLYLLASTDFGLNVGWLDMTSYQRPVTRAVYAVVLAADEPSPLLPESDEEEVADEEDEGDEEEAGQGEDDEESDEPEPVRIDFAELDQRIISLGIPEADYLGLDAGAEGVLFYAEAGETFRDGFTLHRYKLGERESEKLLDGLREAVVSSDGKKVLYGTVAGSWGLVDADGSPAAGDGALDLSGLRMKVDPAAEWRQIFREAWRFQRDYFYVDNVHGLDMERVWEKYSPWLEHVRHRSDLTHLLDVLGGETAVGHSFTGGGDRPDVDEVPVGLLGADLAVEEGRYRIAKIYRGENWNPDLTAPLSGPGIDARAGDYLLAVDGVALTAAMNPHSLFDRTAGRQTVLTLSAEPSGKDAREVTVVPVESETQLRRRDWMESNRRKVDEMSDGRLAYVYLPNTGGSGYRYFNRYYFAQQDRPGVVIDERFNGGGSAADYMVDLMARPLMGYFNNPVGEKKPFKLPNAGIWGPKVMIINDAAGSGGDLLPYMFRLRGIGPLVGTRTWGGLVGIWDVPDLVDGGFITAPRGGFFNLDGEWEVENEGVAPDVEVEQLPAEVIAGRDPQLERAVEIALELLGANPVQLHPQPPDPVRVRRPE
ncbi:MAG: PDZ domain-containing protein [Thermoanaerobaculia bacterium]|nr:PDZ domain-containing protein [Thermoanaerobaculia bacterium]